MYITPYRELGELVMTDENLGEGSDESTIFVGKKPIMYYALAVVK